MRHLALFEKHPVSFATAMADGKFRAFVDVVHDGDSFFCLVDRGFFDYAFVEIRLADVNTAEIVGAERAQGLAAKAFVEQRIAGQPVLLTTRLDSSGDATMSFVRYVADVIIHDAIAGVWFDLAQIVRDAGFDKLHPLP